MYNKTHNYYIYNQINNILSNLVLNNKEIKEIKELLLKNIECKSGDDIQYYTIDKYNIDINFENFESATNIYITIWHQSRKYILIKLIIFNNELMIESKQIYYNQISYVKITYAYKHKNDYMFLYKPYFNNIYKYNIYYKIAYFYKNYKMSGYMILKKLNYKKIKQIYIIYSNYKIYYFQKNENNKKYIHIIYNKDIINYLLNKNNINKIII